MNSGIDKTLMRLLGFFGLFFFVTMPGWICPSDAYVSRAESANVVMTGKYGIDYSIRTQLGDYDQPSMMILNDAKEKIYSWNGIVDTLVYIPIFCLYKLVVGKIDLLDSSLLFIAFININNIFFSLVIIYYIYRITGLFSECNWQRGLFVILSVFSTNLWFYLRSQHHEIFQLTMFLGFVFHFIIFLRASENGTAENRWNNLMWSSIWLALLFLTKAYYATVILVACVFVMISGKKGSGSIERINENLLYNKTKIVINYFVPVLFSAVICLLMNKVRTGQFFSTGYVGVEVGEDYKSQIAAFSPMALSQTIPGYLLRSGNCNIFLHNPIFLLSICGIVRFVKKWPSDSLFIYSVFLSNLAVLLCYYGWDGGMSYGPRFFLVFLVVASLPFLELLQFIAEGISRWRVQLFSVIVGVVLLYSTLMQISVNSIGNFTCWTLEYRFNQTKDHEIDAYFVDKLTRASIYRDMLLYKLFDRRFPPAELVKQRYLTPQEQATFDDGLKSVIEVDLMVVRLLAKR